MASKISNIRDSPNTTKNEQSWSKDRKKINKASWRPEIFGL